MMQITFDIISHEITFSFSLISARLSRSDSLSHFDLNVLIVAVLYSSADTFRFLIENYYSTLNSIDAYGRQIEAQQLFLLSCGSHGSSDVVKYLATKHPELINAVDESNTNGLHLASWQGNLE